jgi:hypothetical protein
MRITTIVVPADEEAPISRTEIEAEDPHAYMWIVEGLPVGVGIQRPPALLVANRHGKINGMPLNRRATLLLWMHAPQFRRQDHLAGPIMLTGLPDENGIATSAPDELVNLLVNTGACKVQVRDGDGWLPNDRYFPTWIEAYTAGLVLAIERIHVLDVRVVPA